MRKHNRGSLGGRSVFRSVFFPVPINKTAARVSGFIDSHRESTTAMSKQITQPKIKEKSFASLPRIAYFRVQYSQTYLKAFNMPWVIFVSCRGDGKGLRLISDVGHDFGKEINECFKTQEEAISTGLDMKKKWGIKK